MTRNSRGSSDIRKAPRAQFGGAKGLENPDPDRPPHHDNSEPREPAEPDRDERPDFREHFPSRDGRLPERSLPASKPKKVESRIDGQTANTILGTAASVFTLFG